MIKLLRRRFCKQAGFTLIELLAVVAIIGVLAALAVPKVYQAINNSKTKSGKADITTIAAALDQFYMDTNAYPTKLADLVSKGYMKQNTNFLNGWGKRYFYTISSTSTPTAYVLADPGQSPDNNGTAAAPIYNLYKCQNDSCTAVDPGSNPGHTAPEGVDATQTAPLISVIWLYDNSKGAAANGSGAQGKNDLAGYFATCTSAAQNPASGVCRSDIITQ